MRYQVERTLGGRGKWGGVELATDEAGRRVTIKRLARYPAELPGLLSQLPGTVETAVEGDGRLRIVREWVEGTDLKSLYTDKKLYHAVPEERYVEAAISVCGQLSSTHRLGLTHRDVKPSNIVVPHAAGAAPSEWRFGEARLIDYEQMASNAFALIYSPPEMVLRRADLIGPPSDLFALGVTLYHMVMGKTPYTDCNPEVLINLQLTYPVRRPARMSDALWRVVEKSTYKSSFRLPPTRLDADEVTDTLRRGIAGRYQSADEMCADLREVGAALRPLGWLERTFG